MVRLGAPSSVTLIEARGLRVACPAMLHGSVLGLDVPVTVRLATFLLEPSIVPRAGREVVVFKVSLEGIDVAAIPHIVEEAAVDAINEAFVTHGTELTWDFRETLSHRFKLPAGLAALRFLDLSAAWGKLRVTPEALVFLVSVHTGAGPSQALARVPRPPLVRHKRQSAWAGARLLAIGGLLALVISAAGLAARQMLVRRYRLASHVPWSRWA